jgi:hypothetical protein
MLAVRINPGFCGFFCIAACQKAAPKKGMCVRFDERHDGEISMIDGVIYAFRSFSKKTDLGSVC